jgi:RimJ/RimL family protein N-acetyltransferase
VTRSDVERVETERMVLARLRPEDLDDMYALLSDPAVARTLTPDGRPPTRREIEANLAGKLEHWQTLGFGLWLARDRATGATVGRGGLQHTYTASINDVEAGWVVVPERWGQGLATEMARAALDAAFGPLELREVVAFTRPDNLASLRVIEKTGFRYEREVEHAGLPHVLYRRAR